MAGAGPYFGHLGIRWLRIDLAVMQKVVLGFMILLVALLVSHPATAEIELFGGDPLLDAIKANNADEVEVLLARGANAEIEDFDRRRPMIYAALLGNADIAEILIRHRVKINHRDKLGNSALFYAASKGEVDFIEILLDSGAAKNSENRQGITPLMIAASLGHLDSVQLLLARGADPKRRDYTGRTALMWADWNRQSSVSRALRNAGVQE